MSDTQIVALAQKIAAEQRKPWDEGRETDVEHHARLAREDEWIGSLYYKGNSIEWSHSKSEKYGRELLKAWDELRKLGVVCDGNTSVAEAISRLKLCDDVGAQHALEEALIPKR